MRASHVMALALVLAVAGRWAHNEKAVDVQSVVGGVFAIVIIAALDNDKTEHIAMGLALIVLAVVVLSNNSPITAISSVINKSAAAKSPATRGGPSTISNGGA